MTEAVLSSSSSSNTPQPEKSAADPGSLHWKVAGRAGEGIDVTGVMFGKLCLRLGMHVFTYREYPSLIRGGHNTHQVHASFSPITCQQRLLDVLIAFNEEGITQHLDELSEHSVVLCEATQDGYDMTSYAQKTGARFFDVPLTNISREETGHFLSQNIVALAMSTWILGLSFETIKGVVQDQFKDKGEEVLDKNLRALERGFAYAQEHLPQIRETITPKPTPQLLLTCNHAIAMGAVAGGLQYFSAYPMTPTSDILHTLAGFQHHFPLVVKHVEDEIAAVNQAIGAAYTGVRAMTASATGGYALMVEGTSLAAVTEVPLVICVGQRPGPATGLPSWTCQADLQFILHAGHGEIPKVVLTPGSVEEHFTLTKHAMMLAEKYHLVVFILSDKFALESYASMPTPNAIQENQRASFAGGAGDALFAQLPSDDSYRRFEVTEAGYSPRSIPGQPHGLGVTNSYEHDTFGYATERADITIEMNDKRQRKLTAVLPELPPPVMIGPAQAELTFVSWGSTRLVLERVVTLLNTPNHPQRANMIHLPCAWPFPAKQFTELTKSAKTLIMVEGNATGQMGQLIRQETGITFTRHIRRYDGRPFYAEDILQEVERI